MKLKKLGAFAATGAMALALALTGCGSSNATSGSDAGSSSSDDAKVEKVDGSKEYALVKDGTLTVGTSAEYAPFEYKDDNGDYQGFDLELIKAIGDKLGLDVEYVNNDFDTLVPGVASGAKYDVAIAAITDTPEREKEVAFSDSYYMDDQTIVTKVDNADITADNYSEKLNNADATIIVQSGLDRRGPLPQENVPQGPRLSPTTDATECFSALQSDKGDAVRHQPLRCQPADRRAVQHLPDHQADQHRRGVRHRHQPGQHQAQGRHQPGHQGPNR